MITLVVEKMRTFWLQTRSSTLIIIMAMFPFGQLVVPAYRMPDFNVSYSLVFDFLEVRISVSAAFINLVLYFCIILMISSQN